MNILIAVDSFKGTLSSVEVAEVISKHIDLNNNTMDIIAIADGGEGTVDSLCQATKGTKHFTKVQDAFGQDKSSYFCLNKDNDTAIIEIALSSGLAYIDPSVLDPFKTTSFGLGQTIKNALDLGVRKLIVGIGGSSSNDGGAGMLQALGVKFLDKHNSEIKHMNGLTLGDVVDIDLTELDSRIKDTVIEVACDVENPLLGPSGCAEVYSRQKGASEEMVLVLEQNMKHFADVVAAKIGTDFRNLSGAGAAGGIGFGLVSFLHAKLISGIEMVAHATNLVQRVKKADLVITGEGMFDSQSLHGKAPIQIARIAKQYNVRCIGIFAVATIENKGDLFDEIFTIVPTIATKNESLQSPRESLEKLMEYIKPRLSI